jgi:hypothetical protein
LGKAGNHEEKELTLGIAPKRAKARWLAALGTVVIVAGLLAIGNVVLAAPPAVAVNLDQCRNGGLVSSGTQTFTQCLGSGSGSSGWVNGNAGASNAHYAEGESISYRARLTNLHNGDAVTLILGYDVIHNGHDALDFLTDKNRWQSPETTVVDTPDLPCSGVTGCDPTSVLPLTIKPPTTNIQVDKSKTLANGCQTTGSGATQQPVTSFNAVPSAQRVMEFFGATPLTFDYVGPTPNLLDKSGDEEQQVQITFTANSSNPVIAWGAHIASRLDWGCNGAPQSASGISGSPYHMRIKSAIVNGGALSLGNQDRSLSAAAVVFLNPGISTTLSATTGSIGDTVHDSASLSGSTSTAGGTVTYTVYTDNSCTTFADVGSGAALGNAGTVTVTNAVVPDSNTITFNHAGTYYWQAAYSGDGNNAPATSLCTSEIIVISPNSPSLTTLLSATSINAGDSVTDTATLSGATSGDTQPITISVYSGSGSSACVAANLVTSATATPATSGDGDYTATFTTLTAGTYEFQASITADNDNNAASSTCGTEPLTVKNSPTAATEQSLIPNDTFKLSGFAGTPSGTVNFYLFPPGTTCDANNTGDTGVIHFTGTLDGTGVASTSNTTTSVSTVGTYTWYVSWDGDSLNNGAASNCVETFSIDNG